jgi:hypothetical protein
MAGVLKSAGLCRVDNPKGTIERNRATSACLWRLWVPVFTPLRSLLAFVGPGTLSEARSPLRFGLDWALGLLLYGAVITWVMRAAMHTSPWQQYLFWGGLPLLFLPLAMRAAWPGVAPGERLFHLIVLAELTFLLKVLFWPRNFAQFDEFLHWITVSDILESHRLFLPNSMLPISPLFPGLEVVTSALVNLSGLPLFVAANLVVAATRGMFIAGLYGFYGRISDSPRLAAIGCLAYMGGSGYVMFDSQFAYETLAVGFLGTILVAHVELSSAGVGARRTLTVLGLLIAAIVLTHHLTALEVLSLLTGTAALQILGRHARGRLDLTTAALGAGLMAFWLYLIGNPLAGYVSPLLDAGINQFVAMLRHVFAEHGVGHGVGSGGGGASSRQAFVAGDGSRTPLWLQLPMIVALPITALLLANGFSTALARARGTGVAGHDSAWRALADIVRMRWQQSWMVLTALLALTWPVSILLRLTAAGWQVGNRLSALSYLGVGLVIGSSILRWWRRPRQWFAAIAAGLALTVIFAGGVVAGWGLPATNIGYKVEADGLSLEPMGIEAAEWTKQWLGIGNRFASDAFNDLLLGTYGRQDVVTSLYDREDFAELFLQPTISGWDRHIIQTDRIDYIMTDLRLTTARPFMGAYFGGDPDSSPLDPETLIKWDDAPGVSRIFDDGWITIYDVRSMRGAP